MAASVTSLGQNETGPMICRRPGHTEMDVQKRSHREFGPQNSRDICLPSLTVTITE